MTKISECWGRRGKMVTEVTPAADSLPQIRVQPPGEGDSTASISEAAYSESVETISVSLEMTGADSIATYSSKGTYLSPDDYRIDGLDGRDADKISFRQRMSASRSSFRSSISSFFERPLQWAQSNSGMQWELISGLLMTFYAILYKHIKNDINRSSVVTLRGIIQLVFFFGMGQLQGVPMKPSKLDDKSPKERLAVHLSFAFVAVIGGIRLVFIFMALQITPISTVYTIIYSQPIIVMLLAHCLLHDDKCSVLRVLASGALLAGLVLTFRPYALDTSNSEDMKLLLGCSFSMMALFTSAFGSVFTKRISQHYEKYYISSAIGFFIIVFALISNLADEFVSDVISQPEDILGQVQQIMAEKGCNSSALDLHKTNMTCVLATMAKMSCSANSTAEETLSALALVCARFPPYFPNDFGVWAIAVVVGFLGGGQQFFLIAALKNGNASRISMVRSIQIVLTFLIQLGDSSEAQPGIDQVFGAVIVLATITVVAMESNINKRVKRFFEARRREKKSIKRHDSEKSRKSKTKLKSEANS